MDCLCLLGKAKGEREREREREMYKLPLQYLCTTKHYIGGMKSTLVCTCMYVQFIL